MKTRNGFVSNSSSSSFVIIGSESIKAANKNRLAAFILEGKNLELFLTTLKSSDLGPDDFKSVYAADQVALTRFLDDHSSFEEHFGLDGETDMYSYFCERVCEERIEHAYYRDGGHGGPYCKENYVEVSEDIFIIKE